jgi:hypothetical protein
VYVLGVPEKSRSLTDPKLLEQMDGYAIQWPWWSSLLKVHILHTLHQANTPNPHGLIPSSIATSGVSSQ